MKLINALVATVALLGASVAAAADGPAWIVAGNVLDATFKDVQQQGILGVASHTADLEQSLAGAVQAVADAREKSCTALTDGMADVLAAMTAASTKGGGTCASVQAVENPYPMSALLLASYYNETGKSEDAVRVLDEGLGASGALSARRPDLISERGAALQALKRWPEALANYDGGLALGGLEPQAHARLLRGRGFSLSELGRLDEAEAAYRESLTLDPNNKLAEGELEYIARLRAGGEKAPTGITLPKNE
jgi:tetratricopeptide (TPR) repeat protein